MLQQLMPKDPIIHLAFFEGIGVAQLATRYLQLNVVKTFSWEIDPFCNELLDHHFSDQIQHMGDFAQTDFPSFCQQLRQTYDTTHIILLTAAPPCKDHSRLRDQPPGTDGTDGSLLSQMTQTESDIRGLLPDYTIRSMMENVIPHRNIKQHFDHISQQWGSPPALIDAADGMVMSRPRLWWTDIRWKEAESRLTQDTPFTLHWQQHTDFNQLHNPLAPLIQPSIHIKNWETPAILCQQQLFHCLTTQAPTDLGRPPPQHTNADAATWDRWQNDNRQFPPWQYQPQYLHDYTNPSTLIDLLHTIHYPHTSQLQSELSHGFSLLGHLHPGVNWHVRTDTKYTNPSSIEDLRQHNQTYIQKKLHLNKTDTHWQMMAEEIATEVKRGRMAGPFQAPTWFQYNTVPLQQFDHTRNLHATTSRPRSHHRIRLQH